MVSIEFSEKFVELFRKNPESLTFRIESDHCSVKHVIEHIGIPHSEIGSIRVHGLEVSFSYRPKDGDWIYVRPLEGPVDVTRPTPLRPIAFKPNHYIVDECVFNLAPKLRMLGCDVIADRSLDDQDIAEISAQEQRVVLTRDRGLLMRKEVVWGRFIRGKSPQEQLKEVIQIFNIRPLENAMQRCLVCNGLLESVSKDEIRHLIEPKTSLYYKDFSQCVQCRKIYWEGSHFDKMKQSLEDLYPVSGPSLSVS